ncbi:MAG TPA: response regulator transcription factor [Candidatus Acidoferrales bacterium]|nr:response regulator transcription factor [Candidatus Acidoferrales bacterium]
MAKSDKKADQKSKTANRIFLVDDHPVFRDGLASLLNSEPDLKVCGEAGDAVQGLKSIIRLKPDLVVVDLGLPGKSGLELIRDIRSRKLTTKLLVVSMFDESVYAQRVLRAGGHGYVMKQEDPEEIVRAIRDVLAGRMYVSEDVLASGAAKPSVETKAGTLDLLTDSELEVLEMLGFGKSAREISQQTGLAAAEVATHCRSMRRKLKLSSANALIRFAVCWVEGSRKDESGGRHDPGI